MSGKLVVKYVSLWKTRLLQTTVKGWSFLPVRRDSCFINIPAWERVFSKPFPARYQPSVPRHAMFFLFSVMSSHPSLSSLGRHQHFKCTGLEPEDDCGILIPAFPTQPGLEMTAGFSCPCLCPALAPSCSEILWGIKKEKAHISLQLLWQAAGDWERMAEFSKGEGWTELLGSRSVISGTASFTSSLYADNKQICPSPV